MTEAESAASLETPEARLEHLSSLLLSDIEYQEHPFAAGTEGRTYVLEYEKDDAAVLFYGSPHTTDPEDSVFDDIKDKFNSFKPEVVFVEGMPLKDPVRRQELEEQARSATVEEAREKGEGFYTLKLALETGIPVESPEPEYLDEMQHLAAKGYTPEDVFSFYSYRMIEQYQRRTPDGDADGCRLYVTRYMNTLLSMPHWKDTDRGRLTALKEQILAEIDVHDMHKYRDEVDPKGYQGRTPSPINKVAEASSLYRDRNILGEIAKQVDKKKRVFVVYGSGHAVTQERALEAFMVS